MRKIAGITAVVLMLVICDLALTYNNFIKDSDYFVKNDFEITQMKHSEKIWDKVFFGNSVVISSYIEEESSSGYINLGLDYGVVTDLAQMLEKHYINIGSELVIGLNYMTLYDDFETNPTYIWHKSLYEPYAYFERDRFYPIITDGFDKLLQGQNPLPYKYLPQEKYVYHGVVADRAMEDKMAEYEEEYFRLDVSDFEENIAALERVVNFCRENGVRVRVVWMPWNTKYEIPQLVKDVRASTDAVLARLGIEVLDMETALTPECFYDSGHLNYDVGSPIFTRKMDEWL